MGEYARAIEENLKFLYEVGTQALVSLGLEVSMKVQTLYKA